MSSDEEFPEADPPRTEEALAVMRAESIKFSAKFGHVITSFTCDDCGYRHKCPLVFDGYNTDGDCLMDK